jgi:hypothetical protein
MAVNYQLHVSLALPPGEKDSRIHWMGGWVGTKGGIDRRFREEKRLYSAVQLVTRRCIDWVIMAKLSV